MQGSKSVQKRRREDEAEVAHRQEAKQQRQQLTSRNHKAVLSKGHDPAQDAREKTLLTVATKYAAALHACGLAALIFVKPCGWPTLVHILNVCACRGVVQLFNALSKAQQARWNSEVQGEKSDKAVKASKAALLKVLKPSKPVEGVKESAAFVLHHYHGRIVCNACTCNCLLTMTRKCFRTPSFIQWKISCVCLVL